MNLTPDEVLLTPALAVQVASGLVLVLACLLGATAIWSFVRRRGDLVRPARLAAGLFAAFMTAAALCSLVMVAAVWLPVQGLQAAATTVAAVAALAAAVVLWRQIPMLLALPSPREVARANLALVQSNASLETTIAWRTHELERTKQRFEHALSRSNITVYTQDPDLRFTWIYNPRLGLTAEELIGRRSEEFLREGARDESLELKRRALEPASPSVTPSPC